MDESTKQLVIPAGFRFSGVHCGLKRNPNKEDISLIVCERPATAAGVYTTNQVFAAPVRWDRARTPSNKIRAVLTNSGNANACTGEQGEKDCAEMAALVAEQIGADSDEVLVMSTGIIGVPLPMEKIRQGIAAAAGQTGNEAPAFLEAARGILTTDNGIKTASRIAEIDGRKFQIAGMCKGAGMIAPNMATMLGVVLTDAPLTPDQAQSLLTEVADETFNCIRVDGHMSTNDTLLLLASGAEAGETLDESQLARLRQSLIEACEEMAKLIPADGEGATHLLKIDVEGCATRADAAKIAVEVADSPLVKTAVTGGDPNWGRIVSAVGYAGVAFDPLQLQLRVNDFLLYETGTPVKFDEKSVSQSMRENFETHIRLILGEGDQTARVWASDLTVEYVKFNADYST
ncbi:MAG: bifunctional glutamate N-acetyltransferase/amino-acid acetyltransferase ArgJ [Blastopirellula sp. JB062]